MDVGTLSPDWHLAFLDRLSRNSVGFVRAHRGLIILVLLASALDVLSTIYVMVVVEATEVERHFAVLPLSMLTGPYIGPIAGKACQLIGAFGVAIYWRKIDRVFLCTICVLYTLAAAWNFFPVYYIMNYS